MIGVRVLRPSESSRLLGALWISLELLLVAVAVGTSAARGDQPYSRASSLVGQLLVASPAMGDPRFTRTVIYMVRHDGNGAMGLVLNRPIGEIALARLFERFGLDPQGITGNVRVHYGGPVQETQGFVLHSPDYVGPETLVVNAMVALTTHPDILRAIGAGAGPRRSLLAFGYAGWAPGQLENEIEAGAWVTAPADEALVFDDDYEEKWQRAMDRRILYL